MSFDLSFWCEDVLFTSERPAEIYDRLTDGEDGVVPSAPTLNDFFAEVVATFGDLAEEVYWSIHGQLWAKVKDLPPGASIGGVQIS